MSQDQHGLSLVTHVGTTFDRPLSQPAPSVLVESPTVHGGPIERAPVMCYEPVRAFRTR